MRILILNWKDSAHPAAGGAEVFTHEVARRWVAAGHRVTLFAAAIRGEPSLGVAGGVKVIREGSRFGVYQAARRFYHREGRGRFDLVIDEINTRPFLAPDWVDDTPVLGLAHQVAREIWSYEFPFPVALPGRFWLEPRWLRRYRDVSVLTVSESSRESLEQYGLRRVSVVPQGLTLPATLPDVPKEDRPTVAFIGRLAANKRPDHALRAFAMAREMLPGARCWVIGAGPMEARLRDLYGGKDIRFFGRVSQEQKFDLLARAHALMVTSVREGWGLVVDEAAAVGTLPIAYDVPGLRDSVPAAGGVLVPAQPAGMAQELAGQLPGLTSQPFGRRHGGAGDWQTVAEAILEHAPELTVGSRR